MKKSLFIVATALSIVACNNTPATDFTVDITTASKHNDKMAYIINYDDSEVIIDSAIVANNHIAFSGKVEEPCMARIVYKGGGRGPIFILEAGDITIDSLGKATGTPLNEAFETFSEKADSLQKEYSKIIKDTTVQAVEQKNVINEAYTQLSESTAAVNQGNPIGYYMFIQKAYEMTPEDFDAAIAADTTLLKYKRVAKLAEANKCKKATSEGSQFTDFEITYDGKTQKLSDFAGKGNYTIVDFWASWCGPCIEETKTLKTIYNKWNGKGLNVVGVAVWDEPENTIEAIATHELPWDCIINGQNIPTDLYGISGIPCIVVIDPQGKIVARDVRGEDLIKFIDEKMTDFKK